MLPDKKLSKVEKILGKERLVELEALSVEALKDKVVDAETSIKFAKEELEANHEYQKIKEDLKILSGSLRDLKKVQNAVIDYSISLLEDKGA